MLLVAGVTADVSGVTVMKYQNCALERKEVGFDTAQVQKQVTVA